MAKNCVRCDVGTRNDFGKAITIYVRSQIDGETRQARYLCNDCYNTIWEELNKFLIRKLVELTAKEKEFEKYIHEMRLSGYFGGRKID
ncbi:MAG: hypothetical protein ACXADW_20990 [Candidatus Hodarchaeales archaeon]